VYTDIDLVNVYWY